MLIFMLKCDLSVILGPSHSQAFTAANANKETRTEVVTGSF